MLSNDVADVRRSCRDISPDPFQKIFCSLGNRSNRFAPDIGRASCGRGVNIHSTNGVMYSICHINHLLLSNRIIALSRRVQGEQNYSKKYAQFRLLVGREYPINSRSCRLHRASVEARPSFAALGGRCWHRPQMRISRLPRALHLHL